MEAILKREKAKIERPEVARTAVALSCPCQLLS